MLTHKKIKVHIFKNHSLWYRIQGCDTIKNLIKWFKTVFYNTILFSPPNSGSK